MVEATGVMVSAANAMIYAAHPMREMVSPGSIIPKNAVIDVFTKDKWALSRIDPGIEVTNSEMAGIERSVLRLKTELNPNSERLCVSPVLSSNRLSRVY
jgi:hypothetical protein